MSNFEILGLPIDEMHTFLAGGHPDPFRILGPHRVGDNLVIRVFRPEAKEVRVVIAGAADEVVANRLHTEGLFQAVLPGMRRDLDYQLRVIDWEGDEEVINDPYCYGTIMGEVDLHLFARVIIYRFTKTSARRSAPLAA
jgi:1,4-alpha-glucan branching enzyme